MGEATKPRFGVSYFGNRYPHHARADMRDMRDAGANFVVLVMSESDLRWNPGTMTELVEIARECAVLGPGAAARIEIGKAATDRGNGAEIDVAVACVDFDALVGKGRLERTPVAQAPPEPAAGDHACQHEQAERAPQPAVAALAPARHAVSP